MKLVAIFRNDVYKSKIDVMTFFHENGCVGFKVNNKDIGYLSVFDRSDSLYFEVDNSNNVKEISRDEARNKIQNNYYD